MNFGLHCAASCNLKHRLHSHLSKEKYTTVKAAPCGVFSPLKALCRLHEWLPLLFILHSVSSYTFDHELHLPLKEAKRMTVSQQTWRGRWEWGWGWEGQSVFKGVPQSFGSYCVYPWAPANILTAHAPLSSPSSYEFGSCIVGLLMFMFTGIQCSSCWLSLPPICFFMCTVCTTAVCLSVE